MQFIAFMTALLAPVGAFLVANVGAIALESAPLVVFLSVFGVEWLTGSVWTHFQLLALLASGAVLALKLAGKVPTITLPPAPAPKPAPKA